MCVISEASEYKHVTFPTIVGDTLAVSLGRGIIVFLLFVRVLWGIRGIKTGDSWVHGSIVWAIIFNKILFLYLDLPCGTRS